jgi:hypothetical protein
VTAPDLAALQRRLALIRRAAVIAERRATAGLRGSAQVSQRGEQPVDVRAVVVVDEPGTHR